MFLILVKHYIYMYLHVVSDVGGSGQGFDPSEFPVLGMRGHNESGLLLGGARPGYGEYAERLLRYY